MPSTSSRSPRFLLTAAVAIAFAASSPGGGRSGRAAVGATRPRTRPSSSRHAFVSSPVVIRRRRRSRASAFADVDGNDDDEDDDHAGVGAHRIRRTILGAFASDDGDDDDEWRAFRARLVRDGLPTLEGGGSSSRRLSSSDDDRGERSSSSSSFAFETTPLVEVGSILISIPTTDLCQALEQQYWHRSVVMITEVAEDLVKGNVEDVVPDDQLAQGQKRGRWSYRGLLLNRCTDVTLLGSHDETATREEFERDAWRVQRGGDLLGLSSSEGTQFACLHPKIDRRDGASSKIMGGMHFAPLRIAQSMCGERPSRYRPEDFATFGGFCSWRPGQLEREMGEGRGEWRVLSVDGGTVWDELVRQRERASDVVETTETDREGGRAGGLLDAGTAMWRNFLGLIDVDEGDATSKLPRGQLDFYDRMLGVWAEEGGLAKIGGGSSSSASSSDSSSPVPNDSSNLIGPGALARAASPPPNDVLLHDPEFVLSLVLVLEDTPDATVGIILNHVAAAAVDYCADGSPPLPLRYGGPVDVPSWRDGSYRDDDVDGDGEDGEDDDDDDDDDDDGGGDEMMYEGFMELQNNGVSFEDLLFDDALDGYDSDGDDGDDDASFVWIHRDARLGSTDGGGSRLGTSGTFIIREDDALRALQSGSLRPEDVMVFSGVCIWEKGSGLGRCGGGLREQVDALGSLEIISNDDGDDISERLMWSILSGQEALTERTLDSNINAGVNASLVCTRDVTRDLRVDAGYHGSRVRLSKAVLKAWMARNLLGDPLNTLVEVQAQ